MNNITHLHVHSFYSFLDGKGKPELMAKRAKELGMHALALTDHNTLAGIWHFQKACHAEGVKPILGLEAYWTWDTNVLAMDAKDRKAMAQKTAEANGVIIPEKINGKKITQKQINELIKPFEYDTTQYHIILLAKDQIGWKNLIALQSEASEKCTFNDRFLCDDEMLAKYSEGLILGTACIGGVIPKLIAKGQIKQAEDIIDKWHAIFGENMFLEIQPLKHIKQMITNLQYIKWSQEKGIKLVATNDVHYVLKEEIESHDILVCMGTGKTIADKNRMQYDPEFWIRSYDEMVEAFTEQYNYILNFPREDAINLIIEKETIKNEDKTKPLSQEELNAIINRKIAKLDRLMDMMTTYDTTGYVEICKVAIEATNTISDMTEDTIKLGSDNYLFPKIDIPKGMTAETHLTNVCFQNLWKYRKKKPHINFNVYEKRLSEELRIINTKGFAPYMLTIWDIVKHCEQANIPVGPGRGSAAGSLVLFLLGVTKGIDPIEYNLLFFRFLTMDRTAMPDKKVA